MNHATAVGPRFLSACSRFQRSSSPLNELIWASSCARHLSTYTPSTGPRHFRVQQALRAHRQPGLSSNKPSLLCFSTSRTLRLLKPYPAEDEPGLAFRSGTYSRGELKRIFGIALANNDEANRLLKVLHARRVDGTLDLPLEESLQAITDRYPQAIEKATQWLRARYPVDEDNAILERFKREDAPRQKENPSVLQQRAFNIGLFKPADDADAEALAAAEAQEQEKEYYGPQSGTYYARLSERDSDPFGRSELEAIRHANEARAEAQERKLQEDIDRSMEAATATAESKARAVATRSTQDVQIFKDTDKDIAAARAPNTFETWVIRNSRKATSELTLDSPEIASKSNFSRALPSFLFVALSCTGLYLFASYWEPPRRSDRWFQNISLSTATISTIIATNLAVFIAWRIPGMWPVLNKFFLVVPAYPRPLSMLFNTFSHQSIRHLLVNLVGLLIFGPSLHEDIGRGNFVALYLASGLVGSWTSLVGHLARGALSTSSLGASGCVWGVAAGYLWLNQQGRFTLFFLPDDLKERFYLPGWAFLSSLVVIDLVTGLRLGTVDIAAHLGGALMGALGVEYFKSTKGRSDQRDTTRVAELKSVPILEDKQKR